MIYQIRTGCSKKINQRIRKHSQKLKKKITVQLKASIKGLEDKVEEIFHRRKDKKLKTRKENPSISTYIQKSKQNK